MKHENLERFEVGELAEIGSCSVEDVTEKAADRNQLVRVRTTPHTHLEEDARAHERGWFACRWVAHFVAAMPTCF